MAAPFTTLSGLDLQNTLARKLIPVADSLRNLRVKFGLRPYEVRIVRTQWTGGERGVGEEVVIRTDAILPTPLLVDLSSMQEIVQPIGLDEVGTVQLGEISGRYTEGFLVGRDETGQPIPEDQAVYYEVVFPTPGSADGGEKRRFFIRSVPHYQADRFQWRLALERAHPDRLPSGDPR